MLDAAAPGTVAGYPAGARPNEEAPVAHDRLIEDHGRLFSEEIGARIAKDTPQEWFHWLLGALLMSARIGAGQATQAVAALKKEGLHGIDAILSSERARRSDVLNRNGYARYDNRGADYIHSAARLVKDSYRGDLRNLRKQAGDRDAILGALTEVQGIGPVGAGIFAREAQLVWDELYPTIDDVAARAARDLGLPDDADKLSRLAGSRERYVRLATALTRVALDGASTKVKEAAS